jgi:hypothetical protein
MKKGIIKWIYKYLKDEDCTFLPKKDKDVKMSSFTSQSPLGNNKYDENSCQCISWNNGEGYDFILSNNNNTKFISLHITELENMFCCLDDLKYFE